MGTVSRFDLKTLAQNYGLLHFVETGTGAGEALQHAAAIPEFRTIRSCDIEPSLVKRTSLNFAHDSRIDVECSRSKVFLANVGDNTDPDEPIFFWLDAHFPGADYGLKPYGAEHNGDIRLPLHTELQTIVQGRPRGRDVIAIDDLRIYVDGPFAHGDVPANLRSLVPAQRGIGFIHETMGATHDVHTFFEHEGYVLLTPKKGQ